MARQGSGRIKEHGGVTIAQEPLDAEYPEMPQNALATGMIDISLPAADMPRKLRELADNARVIHLPPVGEEQDSPVVTRPDPATSAERALLGILATLRARAGHDFRHYKRATILRPHRAPLAGERHSRSAGPIRITCSRIRMKRPRCSRTC